MTTESTIRPTAKVPGPGLTARQIWQAAMGELQLQMTRPNFETWLRQASAVAFEDDVFVLRVPSTFAAEWIDRRLRPSIEQSLRRIIGRPVELEVTVGHGPRGTAPVADATPATPRATPTPRGRVSRVATVAAAESVAIEAPTAEALVPVAPLALAPVARVAPGTDSAWTPNPNYTFTTFVEGASNRLAFNAALGVADAPGKAYNPLFIWGGVGLGKTHLLHAIAHVTRTKGYRVLYVTSETFTNDMVNAIRERRNEEFRNRYRTVQVLLIDDIQFIAGKEGTQEEFFHTFNALHDAGNQLVLTSDRPPKAIQALEERLRSRFEWGMAADVQPPDLETRRAILLAKAATQAIQIPDAVIGFLADRIRSNIRELEGSLNRVVAYSRLMNQPLTVSLADSAIEDLTQRSSRRKLSPSDVISTVARYYKADVKDLKGKARDQKIVLPRQVAMYVVRQKTDASLLEIGRELGGRDHTTILYGCDKIEAELQDNVQLRRDLSAIEDMLVM